MFPILPKTRKLVLVLCVGEKSDLGDYNMSCNSKLLISSCFLFLIEIYINSLLLCRLSCVYLRFLV